MAVNYKIEGIAHSERLKLLELNGTFLLAPASLAVINYCHLAKIHELKTDNDIEELWFRINYIRNFGIEMWDAENGKQHPFEPYYDDLVVHKGLVLPDTQYMARKQWINQNIDLFIQNNNELAENNKLHKLSQDILVKRESLHDAYIEQETGRKTEKPNNPAQKPNPNADAAKNANKEGVPDIVLKQHNENVLNIAIEKRRKGAILTEEETKLLQKLIDEDPDRAAQILSRKPAPVPEVVSPPAPTNETTNVQQNTPTTTKKATSKPQTKPKAKAKAKPVKSATKKT